MELGLYTFVPQNLSDAHAGEGPAQRLRELMEEIELADQLGLDVFGVGEHHRQDFAVSTPAIVMAAAAVRTQKIRLTSAVTVLSSDDPVRVYQQYATVDLLSGGRAEIMAGRGSFIESFPLFGFDLEDYDDLFGEKLELLLQIRANEYVTWQGKFRPPLNHLPVYPRALQNPLPVWVAVGGNAGSAVRAGTLGLPMALAIIGGMPERFTPFAEMQRQAARRAGHDPVPALSINSHGFIADTYEQAIEVSFPAVSAAMNRIGRERGWTPMTKEQYEAGASLRGAYFVGSPQQVIEKILFQHELFNHERFLIQFSVGTMPHEKIMRSIELFGTEVAPVVRKEVASRTVSPALP
ncbi:MAG: LLM class flavin-dependent oxidoreductase [Actinomycetota bacterium]